MGKIEHLYVCLVQQKTLQALQSSAINKIPNIPQCTLPPQPMCQTLLSDFSRVWLRDYLDLGCVIFPLTTSFHRREEMTTAASATSTIQLVPQPRHGQAVPRRRIHVDTAFICYVLFIRNVNLITLRSRS